MNAIKSPLIALIVLLSGWTAVRADSAADVIKDAIKLTNDYGAVVASAKSEDTAKEAGAKVAELAKSAAEVKARADKLEALSDDQKKELAKTVGDGADVASQILLGASATLAKKSKDEAFAALQQSGKAFSKAIGPVLAEIGGTTLTDSHDRLMGDAISIMTIMADALAAAKDEPTAKVASDKIKALEFRTKSFQARADLLGEPDPSQIQTLMAKHMAGLMKNGQKLQQEAIRIQQDPKLAELLGDAMKAVQGLGN
ncbi:MAG: hypothetical protein WD768_09710 [Phycisphaeraceae bacterium]